MYKFNGKHYMTRGIQEKLPAAMVMYLFRLIEQRKELAIPMDYLQVFELEQKDKSTLLITHSQEEPEYVRKYILNYDLGITDKIFVIDDIEHSTILFANEY